MKGILISLRSGRGFTLLEVLLAVTLFTIIISSSYGIFSMGMHIWRRSQGRAVVERKTIFALEMLGRDLRMTVRVTDPKDGRGKGSSGEIFIPALIPIKTDKVDMIQYGFVRYHWDSGKHELCRAAIPVSDLENDKESSCRVIASQISSFKLRYLIYDGIGESYSWFDEWEEKEEIPIAVEVTLQMVPQLKGEKSPTLKIFKQTLSIPVGGMIKEQDDEKDKTTVKAEG